MLKQTCQRYGFSEFIIKEWVCAMTKYAYFWGTCCQQEAHVSQNLTTACTQQGIPVLNVHHAAADCFLTLELIRAMANAKE